MRPAFVNAMDMVANCLACEPLNARDDIAAEGGVIFSLVNEDARLDAERGEPQFHLSRNLAECVGQRCAGVIVWELHACATNHFEVGG